MHRGGVIHVTKLRELDRPRVSAASGLVRIGENLYVIADDALHLGVYPAAGTRGGRDVALLPGELPAGARQRKAVKPDFEVLSRLPAFAGHPAGALLALGSGSRPNRRTGALLALDGAGGVAHAPRPVDLTETYDALERRLGALDIEGAVATSHELILLQRGGPGGRSNALVRVRLAEVLHALASAESLGSGSAAAIEEVDLGSIDGVALGFTDGTFVPGDGLVFTAVAEATEDSYEDGPCLGAAVGLFGLDGRLRFLQQVDRPLKVEGVEAWIDGDVIRLLLVTDADDPGVPAALLAAQIHRWNN